METQTFPPPPPPPVLPVQVDQIIGTGQCQVLVTTRTTLSPPAIEIKDIDHRVTVDEALACTDHVVINATLTKNINYKARRVLRGCTGNFVTVRCGDLRFCFDTAQFSCIINIPGVRRGDTVEVLRAGILNDCDFDFLEREGLILREKVIVEVRVKVIRRVERIIR
jgi:hypothetical protein